MSMKIPLVAFAVWSMYRYICGNPVALDKMQRESVG
jgi:hypothetical protein